MFPTLLNILNPFLNITTTISEEKYFIKEIVIGNVATKRQLILLFIEFFRHRTEFSQPFHITFFSAIRHIPRSLHFTSYLVREGGLTSICKKGSRFSQSCFAMDSEGCHESYDVSLGKRPFVTCLVFINLTGMLCLQMT